MLKVQEGKRTETETETGRQVRKETGGKGREVEGMIGGTRHEK